VVAVYQARFFESTQRAGSTADILDLRGDEVADFTELTALIFREGDGYVSRCPELEIASQGDTVEEAKTNLIEALEGFFLTASEEEIRDSLHPEVWVTRIKVPVG
jgi:predicted RNase H-like HicB family nuclease